MRARDRAANLSGVTWLYLSVAATAIVAGLASLVEAARVMSGRPKRLSRQGQRMADDAGKWLAEQ